jgi:hypothetical protein
MYNYKPPSTTCCGWGFIVDGCKEKEKIKRVGIEKNKSKHLRIIKNRYKAHGSRRKEEKDA